ncbi:MAG: OmpA family protein [Gammaproteobacteria bacterium]
MKIRGCLLAAVVCSGVPFAASADDLYPRLTVYGGYSHALADDDSPFRNDADDGVGFFVGTGVPITRYFNVDFVAHHHEFADVGAGVDAIENGIKADFLFYYSRERLFSPYVGLGAGYNKTRFDGAGFDEEGPFFDAGLGFHSYPFLKGRLGWMGDLRYRWLKVDGGSDTTDEVIARIGLVVPFGLYAAAGAVPVVDKPAQPAQPTPEAVTEVDLERRFTDVLFAFDKYDLSPTAISILDDAAETINRLSEQDPNVRVKVDGHTDWIGTDAYNMGLGERRANAVKQYLIRKGVASDRIDTTSYGESKPVATNETAEGRALNRRSEVRTTAE